MALLSVFLENEPRIAVEIDGPTVGLDSKHSASIEIWHVARIDNSFCTGARRPRIMTLVFGEILRLPRRIVAIAAAFSYEKSLRSWNPR